LTIRTLLPASAPASQRAAQISPTRFEDDRLRTDQRLRADDLLSAAHAAIPAPGLPEEEHERDPEPVDVPRRR